MGLIRPLVYLTIGFVAGNLYNSCSQQDSYQKRFADRASLERIVEVEKPEFRVEHAKAY